MNQRNSDSRAIPTIAACGHYGQPMLTRIRKLLLVVLALGCVWTVWAWLYEVHGIGIPCIIHSVTGLYCSGCGAMRATIALARLQPCQAFRYNAFFVLCLPFLLVVCARSIYLYLRYGLHMKHGRRDNHGNILAVVVIVAALLFAIARNTALLAAWAPTAI